MAALSLKGEPIRIQMLVLEFVSYHIYAESRCSDQLRGKEKAASFEAAFEKLVCYQIAAIIVGITEISTPAATADPITPDTFGPIACMRRKFCVSASCPTLLDTRAAIGTAETPADPMSGLVGCFGSSLFMSFPRSTPPAVPRHSHQGDRIHRPGRKAPLPPDQRGPRAGCPPTTSACSRTSPPASRARS